MAFVSSLCSSAAILWISKIWLCTVLIVIGECYGCWTLSATRGVSQHRRSRLFPFFLSSASRATHRPSGDESDKSIRDWALRNRKPITSHFTTLKCCCICIRFEWVIVIDLLFSGCERSILPNNYSLVTHYSVTSRVVNQNCLRVFWSFLLSFSSNVWTSILGFVVVSINNAHFKLCRKILTATKIKQNMHRICC